mmetsp:Transcript_15328/g.47882  ORF Transcript_15328/g.47882 Transcript_15328/m.47882 type:complete len:288 (-) Transcript_15328:304-1167(-)
MLFLPGSGSANRSSSHFFVLRPRYASVPSVCTNVLSDLSGCVTDGSRRTAFSHALRAAFPRFSYTELDVPTVNQPASKGYLMRHRTIISSMSMCTYGTSDMMRVVTCARIGIHRCSAASNTIKRKSSIICATQSSSLPLRRGVFSSFCDTATRRDEAVEVRRREPASSTALARPCTLSLDSRLNEELMLSSECTRLASAVHASRSKLKISANFSVSSINRRGNVPGDCVALHPARTASTRACTASCVSWMRRFRTAFGSSSVRCWPEWTRPKGAPGGASACASRASV